MLVVHFTGPLNIGGIERWLERMSSQAGTGFKMVYGVNRGGGALVDGFRSRGARVVELGRFSNPTRYIINACRLLSSAVAEADGPLLVHIHTGEYSWMALAASALSGIRNVVVHSHNDRVPQYPLSFGGLSLVFTWLAVVIMRPVVAGCSYSARQVLFPLHSSRSFLWIPYCLADDFPEAVGLAMRRPVRPIGRQFRLGNIGRLAPQKNQEYALLVLAELRRRGHDATLSIVGAGELLSRLRTQAAALGVGDYVEFCGARNDVLAYLANEIDVFIFPSLWEGFPIAMLEAQAVGVPIVCADTITKEARVAPKLITALPTSDQAVGKWVDAVLAARRPTVEEREKIQQDVSDRYSARSSWGRLSECYCDAFKRNENAI